MRLRLGVWMVFPPSGSMSPQPKSSQRMIMKLGFRRLCASASFLTVRAATVAAAALKNSRRSILRPLLTGLVAALGVDLNYSSYVSLRIIGHMNVIVENHRLHSVRIGRLPANSRIARGCEVGPGCRHRFRQSLCFRRVAGALFALFGVVEAKGQFRRMPGTAYTVELR